MVRISGTQIKLGIALSIFVMAIVIVGAIKFFPTASNQGYHPDQPIPFSHKQHAGDNKIPCLYCHDSAERSRHATVPTVAKCMNCHSVVKTESPHIQKIKKAYDENKPIEWIRVHELPDYVYFPHKRHVAKGVACEVCHGEPRQIGTMVQHAALTMGWCMECHRGETAPPEVLRKVYPKEKDPHGPVAPIQCSTCHN